MDRDPVLSDGSHRSARSVINIEPAFVLPADHAVPDRELELPEARPLPKLTGALGPHPVVQSLPQAVIAGDQDRLLDADLAGARAPRLDRRPLGVGRLDHPQQTVEGLLLDVRVRRAAVKSLQQLALARVALAHHLHHPDRALAAGQRPKPTTRLHTRQLPRVTDRDHLRTTAPGLLDKPRDIARGRHRRFVKHHHRRLRAEPAVLLEVHHQPRERR